MMHVLLFTLVHSLWQATLIAVALAAALRCLSSRWSSLRYQMSLGALAAVLACAVLTWSVLGASRTPQTLDPAHSSVAQGLPPQAPPSGLVSRTTPIPSPTVLPTASGPEWDLLLTSAWGFGVAIMLGRMAIALRAWHRLSRQIVQGGDELLHRADALRRRMRISRSIRLGLSDAVATPCVIGLLSPMILIPAALAGQLPAGQMAMVLAHELAHIGRWDALVNVLQMLVEALLFFNPAMWWISRQVRIEREACCDAWAVGTTGGPADYAQALARCAAATIPGMALAMGENDGHLLHRVRRVLFPQSRPEVRLPWYSLLAVCVVGLSLLGLAGRGTLWAVEKILTPQERIDHVAAAEKEYAGEPYDPKATRETITISGKVRTWDGKPVPRGTWGTLYCESKQSSSFASLGLEPDGSFSHKATSGRIQLAISAPGYATKKLPAFNSPDSKPLDIVLERERPILVSFVDANGMPISGLKVQRWTMLEGGGTSMPLVESDAKGQITVDGGDLTTKIECTKHGFAYRCIELPGDGEPQQTVTLSAAKARSGRVVDQVGKAVPNAVIRMAGRERVNAFLNIPDDAAQLQQLATTDSDGRFVLDTLADDAEHTLWIQKPGFAPELFSGVLSGQANLTITLGPPRIINGKVIGDVSSLPTDWHDKKKRTVEYSVVLEFHGSGHSYGRRANVTPTADGGEFTITDLPPCTVDFSGGAKPNEIDMKTLGARAQTTIDLRPIEQQGGKTRTVTLRLVTPPGSPVAHGKVKLSWYSDATRKWNEKDLQLDVRDEASADLPVGSRLSYRLLDVPGYAPVKSFDMPIVGDEPKPMLVSVNLVPAGTIVGEIVDDAGKPIDRVNLSLVVIRKAHEGQNLDVNEVRREMRGDGTGRFAISPLPLGGEYLVVASASSIGDARVALSEPTSVDERNPIRQAQLSFGKGRDVDVELVDEHGRPAQAEVSLDYDLTGIKSEGSWGSQGAAYPADLAGRYTFHNVTAPRHIAFKIHVRPGASTCGIDKPILDKDTKVRIVLPAGRTIRAQLIDKSTGKPLAGRRFTLRPDWRQSARYGGQITGTTDAEGRFSLGCLEPVLYNFSADDCDPPGTIYTKTPGGTQIQYPSGGSFLTTDASKSEPQTVEAQVRPK